MREDSRIGTKIKWQLSRFANGLSEGLSKPCQRLIQEMMFGIQAAKDVKLSNIARALGEPIRLIKTENRLSRNLAAEDWSDRLNERIVWQAAGQVERDTVLAVDLSDVSKRYAKKMECLVGVRDGSEGEKARGYWLLEIVGADVEGDRITPLYGELYSHEAPRFQSENDQLLRAVERVTQMTCKRGILAWDRGGDRYAILIPLLERQLRFVIRQDGDRHVILESGKKVLMREAVRRCRSRLGYMVRLEREGHVEEKHLELGVLAVRLPKKPECPLWLVVIRGWGQEPILLLTNVSPDRQSPERPYEKWIAEIFLTRHACEDTFRFLKQAYRVEDVRVRRYTALRNTYVLVHAVMYFVSAVIGTKARLTILFKKLCEKAKRFFEIATFFHYAVADGIYRVLFGSPWRTSRPPAGPPDLQQRFAFARPPS
jgi:hypothetical protein